MQNKLDFKILEGSLDLEERLEDRIMSHQLC